MQLHRVLYGIGFMLFLLGMASMDSELVYTPVAMFVIGLAILVWGTREDGYLRKGGKRR